MTSTRVEMKLVAFDLETAKLIPSNVQEWKALGPLGISCAALAFSDRDNPRCWYGLPQLSPEECQSLVRELERLASKGYTIITWNGCKFDFNVLAQESGLVAECAQLARNHVDLMLMVTFTKGWLLSLQKALEGSGLKGKLKVVTLSSGEVIHDMDGAIAPQLWADGEVQAVLDYLQEDVKQLLELATVVARRKRLEWVSTKGSLQSVVFKRLLTVQECLLIPEPDVTWMSNPPKRHDFVGWAQPYWK